MSSALTGWPFWAPSDLQAVERALDLAGVRAGDHLVDLGCGDGQVLVAAARRGARVSGVECDAALVERARQVLDEHGVDGDVVEGDVFETALDGADVIFTYLAPASLQRLTPRLQQATGARLVTVDFAVPNLAPSRVDGLIHRYDLPAPPDRSERVPGWQAAAALVAAPAERHSLTCLTVRHPGGAVDVTQDGLADALTFAAGADLIDADLDVAVDLRWEELPEGSFVAGRLSCAGAGDIAVFGFVTDEDDGLWEVTDEGLERLNGRLAEGWVPASFAALLAACDED